MAVCDPEPSFVVPTRLPKNLTFLACAGERQSALLCRHPPGRVRRAACGLCMPCVSRLRSGFDGRMGCTELHERLSKPGFALLTPRTSLARRASLARATLPCALRSFSVLSNLPELEGAARSGCTRLPLSFLFLLFLLLVVMRLDGEEHGRAQHEQLERNKDDGDPIHDFLDTLHRQPRRWFKPG